MSVSPSSRKRKVGESNPVQPRNQGSWLATRFLSQFGYLPYEVDPPGIEPGLPVCRTGVVPLDHEPIKWSAGESNPDYLGASQASSPLDERPITQEVRPGVEPGLRPYHGRVLPEHLQTFK